MNLNSSITSPYNMHVPQIYQQYNLNYEELNNRLTKVKKEFGMRRAISSRSLTGETRTFAEILDQEVEKIVLFYLRAQGELAQRVWDLRYKQVSAMQEYPLSMENIEGTFQKYRDISQNILDLLEYLDFNVNSLRKIIKKHDCLFDQKMGSMYFDTRIGRNPQNSQLVQLYHQEGIRAIIGTVRRGFEDLYDAKHALLEMLGTEVNIQPFNESSSKCSPLIRPRTIPRISYKNRLASFSSDHDNAASTAWRGPHNIGMSRRNRSTNSILNMLSADNSSDSLFGIKENPKLLKKSISDLEPILKKIGEAANVVMLSQTTSTSEYMANHSILALDIANSDLRSEEAAFEAGLPRKKTSQLGLYLNLFVTFLYMANQYVVAPTSGQYADLLGMSASMSGFIIGLSPTAALVSTLLYSMWTNFSFRSPLLLCVCCAIAGNMFYGMALQVGSPSFIFVGRLLTGLSGPRVISRRYIVDHVALEDRTIASSQFVTAGALGLACGPLFASILERLNLNFEWRINVDFMHQSPEYSILLILYQTETAPGWIMCSLWLTALVVLYFFFEDPLEQQSGNISKGKSNLAVKVDLPKSRDFFGGEFKSSKGVPLETVEEDAEQSLLSTSTMSGGGCGGSLSTSLRGKVSAALSRAGSYGAIPSQNIVWVESGIELTKPETLGLSESNSSGSLVRENIQRSGSISRSDLDHSLAPLALPSHNSLASRSGRTDSLGQLNSNGNTSISGSGKLMSSNSIKPRGGVDSYQSGQMGSYFTDLKDTSSGGAGKFTNNFSPMRNTQSVPPMYFQINRSESEDFFEPSFMRNQNPFIRYINSCCYRWGNSGYSSISASAGMGSAQDNSGMFSFLDFISVEVAVILLLYIVNKAGQEMAVSSIPSVTHLLFHWGNEWQGYYMALIGAMVLPSNLLVNTMVKDVEDRDMVLNLSYACIFSILILLNTSLTEYTVGQYIIGNALLFSALNSMEGIIMSLLAKLVSPELAKGTFNSGLLATEAGTLGRVFADMGITAVEVNSRPSTLINILYLPLAILLALSIIVVNRYFDRLN